MRKKDLILGIYTPIEWHNLSKPRLNSHPYNYCWVCRKMFRADYMRWWRKKKKILSELK